MDADIVDAAYSVILLFWNALQQSALFSLLVLLLKVYSAVLLIDFVLILFVRNLGADIKKLRYGTVRPVLPYAVAERRWKRIYSKLDTDNVSYYKAAILEADSFIEELIGQMGYEGRNLKERCDAVPEGQVECVPLIREAHETRNRIIREPDFIFSRDEAKSVLSKYRKLLDELDLL